MPTYKSDQFVIETYKVRISQGPASNSRTIDLVSPALTHGIRFKASMVFLAQNPYKSGGGIGQIVNLGAANFDPIGLAVWFDASFFDGFYAVLSTEKPVSLWYEYEEDPGSTTKLLRSAALLTGTEQPGDFEKAFRTLP